MRSRDRALTERAFIAAARRMFSEKGYENATTKEIAVAAGCNEALIKRYFDGKDGLLLAVFESRLQRSRPLDLEHLPYSENLQTELRRIFEVAREDLGSRSDEMRIVMSRILIDPDFYQKFLQISMFSEYERVLQKRLEHYGIKRDVDLQNTARIILDAIFQICFVKAEVFQFPAASIEESIQTFCHIFAQGLQA